MVSSDVGYVLLDSPLLGFGPALVWADAQSLSSLHLIVDSDADVLARRASLFSRPPAVWQVEGTSLVEAPAAPVPVPEVPRSAPELAEVLVDADLEVVVEDGIVRGEVLGLEVARIVHDFATDGTPLDGPLLEVGVGQADREMTAVVHSGLSPTDQVARIAQIVRHHRRADADRHPLNQLAPERWLRAQVIADPGAAGLPPIRAAQPAVPRPNLRDRAVAIATGEGVVVAFSVGVDLDLVPAAADARLVHDPGAELVLVVPERDAHPVTQALAARLGDPARLVTVPDNWHLATGR